MSNLDDDNIQKISRMLEIGGTMLAQHCDNCGAPLFRYQGRIMCPVCDSVRDPRGSVQQATEVISSSMEKVPLSSQKAKDEQVAASTVDPYPKSSSFLDPAKDHDPLHDSVLEVESLIIRKMIGVARSMQDETDARRIAEHLDLIDRCVDIMSRMRQNP
ncbi:Sjogren's syndrome/scleroderma autoantigen 1 family protein [Methanolobus sp. WCC5]|uniref:Sjogren's syndrome/scleroderma autoantigen 1 family protein n=1 Tax=Methanolobus sp. WCC5 TaxID=3125785 RepID=UPI003245426A